MIDQERIVDNFIKMVKIASPSLKEREIADYIKNELKELGLEVFEDGAGSSLGGNTGNIIGILKGKNAKKLMLSAHMDTVLPCDNIKPIIENGVIKSDGRTILGGDDKAGIAAIIEALKVIKEEKYEHPEIIVLFSVAEEIGLKGAKEFEIDRYKPDYSFILDSGGKPGVAIIQSPYNARGEIKVIGRSAHAGISPENGVNALTVAAHAITKLKLGRIDSETTANIGMVRGGEALNIVMPEVVLKYEARSFSKEKLDNLLKESEEIFRDITTNFNAKYEYKMNIEYAGCNLNENEEIVKVFKAACENAGFEYVAKSTGGGSDSNVYTGNGYKAMTIGVGMARVHTTDEFIKIDDLVGTSKLVVELIKELA